MMSSVGVNGSVEIPLTSRASPTGRSSPGVTLSGGGGFGGGGGAAANWVANVGGEEERVELLEGSRGTEDEEVGGPGAGPGPGAGGVVTPRASNKRAAVKPFDRDDLERPKRRGNQSLSSHGESLSQSIYEGARWLWGGSPYSGVLCMAASSLSYSLMGLLVKLLAAHQIPSFETVCVRCALMSVLAGVGLKRMGHPLLGSPNVRLLLLGRAVLGFIALSSFFYSIQVLPLRDATILNFTAPVFTAILARIFLHERFGLREGAGTLCSLMGVLLVTQPPLIFGEHPWGSGLVPSQAALGEAERAGDFAATGLALLAAAMGGGAFCFVRAVGKTGEPPLVCVFVFAAFSTPAALICLFLFQSPVLPGPLELVGMLLVGLTAFAAQILLTRGLQLEKAGKATAMQYVKVLATYILGVVFLGEIPSVLGIMGALLIGGSSGFIAMGRNE